MGEKKYKEQKRYNSAAPTYILSLQEIRTEILLESTQYTL